jgi:hypothetical protein
MQESDFVSLYYHQPSRAHSHIVTHISTKKKNLAPRRKDAKKFLNSFLNGRLPDTEHGRHNRRSSGQRRRKYRGAATIIY